MRASSELSGCNIVMTGWEAATPTGREWLARLPLPAAKDDSMRDGNNATQEEAGVVGDGPLMARSDLVGRNDVSGSATPPDCHRLTRHEGALLVEYRDTPRTLDQLATGI